MWWSLLVWCCVVAARAEPAPVTVLQMRLTYNEVHVLQLNATIEYILELTQVSPRHSSRVLSRQAREILCCYSPRARPAWVLSPARCGCRWREGTARILCWSPPGNEQASPSNINKHNSLYDRLTWLNCVMNANRNECSRTVHVSVATPSIESRLDRVNRGDSPSQRAVTWQLPFESEGRQLFELERMLCPDDTADDPETSACSEGVESAPRQLFLHVSSACSSPVRVSLRASLPPAWRLHLQRPLTLTATISSPRVVFYEFSEGQSSVRLTLSSEADVCATISVQQYQCPIAQSLPEVSVVGLRMTMLRSSSVQLLRADFPRGFYVVSLVRDTDQPCGGGVNDDGSDWLFEEVFKGRRVVTRGEQRRKDLTIAVEPALSRTQYLVASVSTLGLFLSFYVLFGALVAAQRWAPFARVVSPRAVLASSPDTSAVERAEGQSEGAGREPRRRLSDATFDSSDASDSDEEEINDSVTTNTVPGSGTEPRSGPGPDVRTQGEQGANAGTVTDGPQPAPAVTAEEQGPFGLPARLHLAALARRGGRTLRARSDRYLSMLSTVAVFYALPVIQFIAAFQIILYNFLCAHRAGALSDFNHVFSNLGYLLLGALFMVQVRRRRLRRKRRPRHQEYGIPAHYGLLSALGAGMMVVGVLSASYHVCPNGLNFQFDTAFMYVLAVLMMVKIYQSRHPDVNARAHATFGVLAVLIALVVWGVLGGGPIFYGLFTVIHVFTFLLLSLRIYYVGQFRLEKQSLAAATSELRRPRYVTRLVLLLIANALNWLLAIYGLLQHKRDFAGHMLQILLGNALVHMCCYLGMKLAHGERLRWYAWVLLAGAAAAWVPALYFFLSGSTDWSSSPALSRHRNHECSVLQFYDSHDLWHMLSAMALYLTFSVLLTWDDGLSAVKRTDIPVF
ncbi:sid-1-related protein 3 precursor [Danaus plexippus plexippus]|uniref:Sid-1-related protein 3 n=1 Tax=Danaus plexippus plexippus TaxID=278856 RepID=A0A212F6B3_DANPL|nr:sid-1-related protein 3 precursor [Danaus plexippus plexippus]